MAALPTSPAAAQTIPEAMVADAPTVVRPSDVRADIVVTGHRYLDPGTNGITQLPLPIEKVPQSISLLNEDFARAADIKNLSEVAQYTPGGIFASYSPSFGNQLWLRGFPVNCAIDGLIVGDQITEPDVATLQRYEIVKGPASVAYGAQSPGGVVNLVSKSASPDAPSYLQALGGSFGRWRLEGQLAGALNASGSIRAIGVFAHEQGGSFIDFVHLQKTVVYGGLDFDVASTLTAFVQASVQRVADTPFNGIPTFPDGTTVPVARSYFVGASDLISTTDARRADAGMVWRPSSLWSFDLTALYQYTTYGGGNVFPYGYVGFDGSLPLAGQRYDDWHVSDFAAASTATRKLDDIGLADSYLVASVRFQHYRYYVARRNLAGGTADVFAGDGSVSAVSNALAPVQDGFQQNQGMNFLTAATQAVVKVANPFTIVGGVAYSLPRIEQQLDFGPFQKFDPGHQLSYRASAILEPASGLNLYASYSESYQPNLSLDSNHDVLPPVKGDQYEVGIKYGRHRILLTAALFEIDERNVAVFEGVADGEALYRASSVRHRGLEFEATGRITGPWQVKSGFALLDPKITDDPINPVNDGETRPWLPRVSANLFTSYDFANGISVGGGIRYVGSVKTYDRSSPSATPNLHPYALADAVIGYTLDRWHVQLNLKNFLDERYYVSAPIFQTLIAGLYPGEPRSFSISLRRDF